MELALLCKGLQNPPSWSSQGRVEQVLTSRKKRLPLCLTACLFRPPLPAPRGWGGQERQNPSLGCTGRHSVVSWCREGQRPCPSPLQLPSGHRDFVLRRCHPPAVEQECPDYYTTTTCRTGIRHGCCLASVPAPCCVPWTAAENNTRPGPCIKWDA